MKIFWFILIYAILFLLLADTKITLKPWSFKLLQPGYAAGVLIVLIGLAVVHTSGVVTGKKKAYDHVDELIDQQLKEAEEAAKDQQTV